MRSVSNREELGKFQPTAPNFMSIITSMVRSRDDFEKCLNDGVIVERAFIKTMHHYGVPCLSNTSENVRKMDLKITDSSGNEIGVEIKKIGVPFRTAMRYVGLPSDKALTITAHTISRYNSENPDGRIFLAVDYTGEPNHTTKGLYSIKVKDAYDIFNNQPQRRHKYVHARDNSKGHNSGESFYVSTDECLKSPDHVFETLLYFIEQEFQNG